MAKTVKPVKAKQAPKEKKTPVKVPAEKPTAKKVEEVKAEEVIIPVAIPAEVPVEEPPHVEHIDFVAEEPVTEKTPQVVMSQSEKDEEKRMKKYASLGTLDYYLNHVKGK